MSRSSEQLLTPTEVSEWLQIPPATLRNWRRYPDRAGAPLPFIKLGREIRYRHGDVEAWIAANERRPELHSTTSRRLRRGA